MYDFVCTGALLHKTGALLLIILPLLLKNPECAAAVGYIFPNICMVYDKYDHIQRGANCEFKAVD